MADQFFGLTDPGRERKNNEDTFLAQQSANGQFIIACVIDGVGGYSGGEVAAALAREAILQRLAQPSGEIIPMIIDCFNLANEKILDEKKRVKEHESMACVATLALVDVEHNQFYFAHVGDTRLYLMRDKSLVKISHDQSFVGFLEDSGRLTEEAAMTHPKRNEINKALGFEANLANDSDYVETGQSPFLPGDMLLLCSDGLTDMVGKDEMTTLLERGNSLKDKCHNLINAANHNGGKDNITVVLAQNSKQPLQHDATRPAAVSKKNESVNEPKIEHKRVSTPVADSAPSGKSKSGLNVVLAILALVFLGTTVWQYLQNKQIAPSSAQTASPVAKQLNAQEIKLQAAINQATGHVLILSDTAYPTPVIISQAIQVNKDSLLIKAKGKIELQSDSAYKGPAFSLTQACKNITLDSLTLNNFQTGITAFNAALSLKNTRFINCTIPVRNNLAIPNKKYISGRLPTLAFKADSLPVSAKPTVTAKKK